jgi:hypothetical protein
MIEYAKVTSSKEQDFEGNIRSYLTADGYTKRSGVPTGIMVQIEGSSRWYRVMNFCNSNSGTFFIKTKNNPFLVVTIEDINRVKDLSL